MNEPKNEKKLPIIFGFISILTIFALSYKKRYIVKQ